MLVLRFTYMAAATATIVKEPVFHFVIPENPSHPLSVQTQFRCQWMHH